MKAEIEKILDVLHEGNYLIESSAKAQAVSELNDLMQTQLKEEREKLKEEREKLKEERNKFSKENKISLNYLIIILIVMLMLMT
jgi:membrane protein insertase Oxa1/YidC/SpoIIIJ